MAAEPLLRALTRVRATILNDETLVRALATGRRRGRQPAWRRVELRYVDLKSGRHLQVTTYDDTQAHTANHAVGPAATEALDALLEEPFGNWHVDTLTESLQVRVTKKGEALVHATAARETPAAPVRGHDRAKARLLPEGDPVLRALGIADAEGRIKPSRQAKYRQVEEFLRALDVAVTDALESGRLRQPTAEEPLRVVDLGCGNAYLTFAAHRHLTRRGLPVHLVGVDSKQQSYDHNTAVADELGIGDSTSWVVASIEAADLDGVLPAAPEVVLALHACDTATDEALARAVGWDACLVLAAPCCHHDVAAQLRRTPTPAPYTLLTRHGILRERLADTLTDTLRASLLRLQGYRVDVMEFVESQHTPRNTLIRAVRSGAQPRDVQEEYDALVAAWGIRPRLAELLA
ncbi:class I SAM-dependent methyltransferase [Nocardioides massiliensis]|uniref:SAM-dependent methyltransferase n=1 Tax=Nocardioides massiliensis TaxID=1325935 RepID=A0ABT9NPC3_9ACTN|nr:SAM-dependent methyltransferase [Nocardioides massiliensis]MDP9822151.1 SAM-dependent methyltransferase [Nocardioides massiliensis]